jgi:hypothetical protein
VDVSIKIIIMHKDATLHNGIMIMAAPPPPPPHQLQEINKQQIAALLLIFIDFIYL